MNNRLSSILTVLFVLISGKETFAFQFIRWESNPMSAQVKAKKLNRPILLFFYVQENGARCDSDTQEKIRKNMEGVSKEDADYINENFIPVSCYDVKTAKELRVKQASSAVVTDPFLNILSQTSGAIRTTEEGGDAPPREDQANYIIPWSQVKNTADQALRQYKDKEPSWKTEEISSFLKNSIPKEKYSIYENLVIFALLEENGEVSKETVETLSNRILARLHNRIDFIKSAFEDDSELSKKWKIKKEGGFVIIEVLDERKEYKVIKRYSRPPDPVTLYALIENYLEKINMQKAKLDAYKKRVSD